MLNSERIASKYGSYGVEIIAHDDGIRYSSLYSEHDEDRVCRTYAVVRFDAQAQQQASSEHEQILAGGSIGATFKANGWQLSKQTLYVGEFEPGAKNYGLKTLMQLGNDSPLAMHVYRLWLKKAAHNFEYATIIEIHHPDYLDYRQLQQLFPVDPGATATSAELLDWQALIATVDE